MTSGGSLARLRTFVRSGVKGGVAKTIGTLGFELKRLNPRDELNPESLFFSSMLNLRHLHQEDEAHTFKFLQYCLNNMERSNAQLFQDLFVLFSLGEKAGGYFVEFGATDGITLSNTFLLESRYGWSGIVAEPARRWHYELRRNRRCSIDFRCVWKNSGEFLEFNEAVSSEFSTINSFSDADYHSNIRRNGQLYGVETVSLTDLLLHHDAPKVVDYLSIDTEGSELEILSSFMFDDYEIRVVTVEHNHSDRRAKIHELLTSKGYWRVFDQLSYFDDWYVRTPAF
jgi:FkbM family methyltransferase